MAKDVGHKFSDCVSRGKLKKFSRARSLVEKELRVAANDLETAQEGFMNKRWKWSTIQAYYSMFHTARALLHSEGYREKSHYCLMISLQALFVSTGKLPEKYVDAFHTAKTMRENADYEEEYSETGARKLVQIAEEFLTTSKAMLNH